jgi:integrase
MKPKQHHSRHRAPDHQDWQHALQEIINANNSGHAKQERNVSHLTFQHRADGLFRMFRLLRAMGFRLAPRNLGGRHIEYLMRYWTADPSLEAELAPRLPKHRMPEFRKTPCSPAYIQQQLSFLRTFAAWIGKPGLVRTAKSYVDDVSLVSREMNATTDRSWDGHQVDFDTVLTKVAAIDPRVALQLEVMQAFGLRRKEAVMFSPSRAEVPERALPQSVTPGPFLMFIRIKRGTKGGRLRFTAVRTPRQQRALARALEYAPAPGSHIGAPGLTLKQALTRFSNVLTRAGVTRKELGVTAHGLRHQFAADLFVELSDLPPPVRAGAVDLDADALRAVYLEIARQLGHNRPQITGAYLGACISSRTSGSAGRQQP